MVKTMSRPERAARTHVISRNGSWAVKKEGATRATRVYAQKRSAVTSAVRIAQRGTEVVVHKRDGSVDKWIRK